MTGKHGAVVLFIGGLDEHTDGVALKQLIRTALKSARRDGFSTNGAAIGCCNILRITDRNSGHDEFGALVEVQPAKLALYVTRVLDGTLVQGRRIHVHRYRNRIARSHFSTMPQTANPEPHAGFERRRDNLRIDLAPPPAHRATGMWSRLLSLQPPARDFGA